jgi:hypothetical protein
MFLPDFVEAGFAHASIQRGDSREPLVKETKVIYESVPEPYSTPLHHPLIVFFLSLLAILLISYRDLKRGKLSMVLDGVLFGIVGFLGLCLLLLWTITSHQAAAKNFNLLWALPTHLVAVIAFWKQPKWLKEYFLVVAVLCGLLLLSFPMLPQKLNLAVIPVIATLGVRAYMQYRIRNRI